MTVEAVIAPGTKVTVTCSSCKGSGENRYYDAERAMTSMNDPHCWRCEGAGQNTFSTDPESCPSCGASWIDGQIRLDQMDLFGSTHFSRAISISRRDLDCATATMCPDCKTCFERGTDTPISLEAASTAPAAAFAHLDLPIDHMHEDQAASDPRGPGLDRMDLVDIDLDLED